MRKIRDEMINTDQNEVNQTVPMNAVVLLQMQLFRMVDLSAYKIHRKEIVVF